MGGDGICGVSWCFDSDEVDDSRDSPSEVSSEESSGSLIEVVLESSFDSKRRVKRKSRFSSTEE